MSAMPIGMPGWPELAASTASMARKRMALASSRRVGLVMESGWVWAVPRAGAHIVPRSGGAGLRPGWPTLLQLDLVVVVAALAAADHHRAHHVAADIDRGPAHVQETVHAQDDRQALGRDVEHHQDRGDHRQRSTGNAGG